MHTMNLFALVSPLNVMCIVVGDKYMVADCGGGTVDLTVHQIEQPQGTLKELYKASGKCRNQRYGHMPIISKKHYSLVLMMALVYKNSGFNNDKSSQKNCVGNWRLY